MPRKPIPEGHEALTPVAPRIRDLDVPIGALDVPIEMLTWADVEKSDTEGEQ